MSAGLAVGAFQLRVTRAALLLFAFMVWGNVAAGAQQDGDNNNSRVNVLHVQGNVYMLDEPGLNNISLQVGEDYIIVVDTGEAELGDELIAAIRSVSNKPILFIANTSSDTDHIGGNARLSKEGWALPNADAPGRDPAVSAAAISGKLQEGAVIIGHKNAMNRVITGNLASNTSVTYGDEGFQLYNKEPILFYPKKAAHSDGDTVVFFRDSEVLSVGELFSPISYPVIDPNEGGSVAGIINAMNDLISLMVPKENEEGGTYVIPGHGWLCDRNDIVNYRDMLTIIRGRIQDMVRKGMKLPQVKAAKPSFDYDPVYGPPAGSWSADKFVEAVYHEVANDKGQKGRNE